MCAIGGMAIAPAMRIGGLQFQPRTEFSNYDCLFQREELIAFLVEYFSAEVLRDMESVFENDWFLVDDEENCLSNEIVLMEICKNIVLHNGNFDADEVNCTLEALCTAGAVV